mmetsp:Transcript_42411/g.90236  ORF Transcript_42411/g.90236 Transcript_42411/m.90236 type:complete len:367 (-) Transcript_42411:35-1135(-)
MTSPTLTVGSILLAFSPTFSLLFLLVSQKPQLVILSVTSAFAYLLSALLSSVVWLITSSIGGAIKSGGDGSAIGTLFALAIPGVICQMIVRCLFVRGYFKVEAVIRRSVAKHEEEEAAANARVNNSSSNGTALNGNSNNNNNSDSHAETNALQLQLNDLSCSVASGCGYALLHSLFLYGTLLASESGESNSYNEGAYAGGGGSTGHGGTLYQQSCGGMPSLINGALISCMFSILDVMWMMLCFFGMRRRSQNEVASGGAAIRSGGSTIQSFLQGLTCRGLSDTPSGGNAAILLVTITHLAAALVLAPNGYEDGCKLSLPLLGGVVLLVAILLRKVMTKGNFLPEDQRRRIQGMQLGLRTVGQSHVE